MTQDQINQLAREYAADPISQKVVLEETWRESHEREFKQAVEFILRNHLIVEKEKADNLWDASQLGGLQPHEVVVQADAVAHALKYLFPETFNQDER